MADLFLYQNAGVVLFLSGDNQADLTIDAVHFPGGGVLPLTSPLTIPSQFLKAVPGGFQLVAGTAGASVRLSAKLSLGGGAAAFSFFGLALDTSKQIVGEVIFNLPVGPVAAASAGFFCRIEVTGSADVSAGGGSTFAETAFTFAVAFDELPASLNVRPIPSLKFPDIGLQWPEIRLPWPDPSNLAFPFFKIGQPLHLPVLSVSLRDFPLQISWQSATLSVDAAKVVTIELANLQITGPFGTLAGRLLLQFDAAGKLDAAKSFFDVQKPVALRLDFSSWQFANGGLAVQWTGVQLAGFVGLLLPDLDGFNFGDPANPADHPPQVTLRSLYDSQGISELRLDWTRDKTDNALELPGLKISSAVQPRWSLLTRRDGAPPRIALAVTLPKNTNAAIPQVAAETVFNLNRGSTQHDPTDGPESERDVHRHGDETNSGSLASLQLSAREALTAVLIDLPLGEKGRTVFLQQFDRPLEELDLSNPATLFTPSPSVLSSLDLTSKATLALAINPNFELPILRRRTTDSGNQLLTVQRTSDPTVDPANKRFETKFDAKLELGLELELTSQFTVDFLWERFAFTIDDANGIGFAFKEPAKKVSLLGFEWTFAAGEGGRIFSLTTKDGNYSLKQAEGSKISAAFSRATSEDEPIVFTVTNFVVGLGGTSFDATVSSTPAKLNGLGTRFLFTQGSLQVRDNHFTAFSIAGSGELPPDLVGPAIADISLQFMQDEDGKVQLVAGSAQLRGSKLLKCQSTRFQFSIDGLGLKFVNDGGFHLYFTLTGKAKYVPLSSDDPSGPLAWLGAIEIQLNDCPLAGDARVLAKHISFLVDLPRKVTFSLLGCFFMEIRSLGFLPSAEVFADGPAAMQIGGQIKFAEGAGDVIDVRIDFHNLYVALPEKGSLIPRLHAKELGVKLKDGDAFDLEGSVDFLDHDEVAPGIKASGFAGTGSLTIVGLPTMSANFAFLRVSRDEVTWVRAWFVYLQVDKLSLRIPVINIFIREVGLGFGYRFTLASIVAADQIDDPKELIKVLTKLSLTQGNLSEPSAWKVDLENPVGSPRWTVALRALIAQNSAAAGITDWNESEEIELPCIFIMDAVIALRSDLTFLMDVRGWIYTNYNDFISSDTLKNNPLLSGFVLLSPAKKRFLAHFASNHNAEFGDHPPLFGFLKDALRDSYFSATLLIEPGLYHMELGWPNMLEWKAKLGPLEADFRGGSIFRVSTTELVIGQSLSARGTLDLSAEVDLGFVGARLHALAQVAYGARYIGVIGFDDPVNRSAFYGAVGIEVQVQVSIEFWLHIDLGFFSIDFDFGLSIHLGFTALLEVGISVSDLIGARGTATVTVGIMGYDLHFSIHVGLHEGAVEKALALTNPFLQIGLEAGEVEPIPGTPGPTPAPLASPRLSALAAQAAADSEPPLTFVGPDYVILVCPSANADACHFLILPAPEPPPGEQRCGFLPVPPAKGPGIPVTSTVDFEWTMPAPEASITIEHFRPAAPGGASSWQRVSTPETWHIRWEDRVDMKDQGDGTRPAGPSQQKQLSDLMRYAYLPLPSNLATKVNNFEDFVPGGDPLPLPNREAGAEDERVHNPSDSAYESAVRGAREQLDGSPYLKNDDRSRYEQELREAFSNQTTVYTEDGKVPTAGTDAHRAMNQAQQLTELRSTFLRRFISDAHEIAAASGAAQLALVQEARACQFGLLFRTTGGIPSWLKSSAVSAGTIRQRTSPGAATPDGRAASFRLFNPPEASFKTNPPDFDRLTHYSSSGTVAIAWDLVWPNPPALPGRKPNLPPSPEDHLLYYHVQRQTVGDLEANADAHRDFFVKNVQVVKRGTDKKGHAILTELAPRFKFVDHFEGETSDDIALLPPGGRTYIYTITPIDVGGGASRKSATIVALRQSDLPPVVPIDAQLLVEYALPAIPLAAATPGLVEPSALRLSFSALPAADAHGRPPVVPAVYNLIFRQEKVLPIGSYAKDAVAQGNRTDGLPTSNARPLRTDIIIPFSETRVEVASDRQFIKIDLAELRAAHVFPAGTEWQPQAWRVFLQTESSAQIPSALAPVQLALRFRNAKPPEGKADRFEERRPELLEWLTQPLLSNFLSSEDGCVEVGLAQVPMPFPQDGAPSSFPATIAHSLDGLLFHRHPLNYRALRFRWNQANSRNLAYRPELHAGYELFEFDADAQTWPLAPANPSVDDLLTFLRRVQEVQLLSPGDLPVRPGDNLAPDLWEAWYPSTGRRLWLLQKPDRFIEPPKESRALYSPWFSWRDSYLVWPSDEDMQAALAGPAIDPVKTGSLQIEGQTLKFPSGKLNQFAGVKYVVVRGANVPGNNGVKRLVSLSADGQTMTLEAGSFSANQTAPADPNAPLSIEPLRPQLLHFFLIKLADDLRRAGDLELISAAPGDTMIDGGALPPGQPTGPAAFLDETNPQRDPYGWNVLKRMGLAFAFALRSRKYGVPITVPEASTPLTSKYIGELLKNVLANYGADLGGYARHLHVEYLIQPGKSVRLEHDPDQTPHEDELLALVQISLRPTFQQLFNYARYTVTVPRDSANPQASIGLTVVNPVNDGVLIDHSGAGNPIKLEKGKNHDVTVQRPPDGTVVLLARCQGETPTITVNGAPLSVKPFGPTDWLAAQFLALGKETWIGPDSNGAATVSDVVKQWALFQRYFARTTSLVAQPDTSKPPEIEPALFFIWLQRFFDHGGDWRLDPLTGSALNSTGAGPWLAAAYPRASTPAFAAPNAVGRVVYCHLIPDQWAHALRYLILPYGRYDRLWESIAQSQGLGFSGPNVPAAVAPNTLVAPAGGLDVVLERLRPLAAPVVLSSRRLDQAGGTEKQPTAPGLYWEVIVEKHPEQILVERNRSLVRHLNYCQIARTLLRHFAYLREQKRFFSVAGDDFVKRIVPVENRTAHRLPGPPSAPDHLDLATSNLEVLRSVALPDRMNVFGRGALVFQWDALPFFYEHRLILVAQTTKVLSPVTDLTQRDFTFESPVPSATGEGIPEPNDAAVNGLRITIALNSFWDCTPKDVQQRWSIEQPEQATGQQRLWSSLADPGVVYELVVSRPSNALETQVEITFANRPDSPLPTKADELYKAVKRGKLFKEPTITGLIVPTSATDNFQLVLDLQRDAAVPTSDLLSSVEISQAAPFEALRLAHFTFPEPESLSLVLKDVLTPPEIDFLLTARVEDGVPIPRDVSFCGGVRQLIRSMAPGKTVTAQAGLGLEQLTTAMPKATLDTIGRTLSWQGALLPLERALIDRWQTGSTFRGLLARLLTALENTDGPEISVPLASQPVTAIPATLTARLKLRGTLAGHDLALVWSGKLNVTLAELGSLQTLLSTDLGAATTEILGDLSRPGGVTTVITIDPNDDWQPRPEQSSMLASLQAKLLLGLARIAYPGPLLRADAIALRQAAGASIPDQEAIGRLFEKSLSVGLGGGTLAIRARRSSAPAKPPVNIATTL